MARKTRKTSAKTKSAKRGTSMKKTAKTAKTSMKKVAGNHFQQLEKDFSSTPAKLAAHVKKEIASHKQNQVKVKKAVAQCSSLIKSLEGRIKATASGKTVTAKKQFKTAKKLHVEARRSHIDLSKQLLHVGKSIDALQLQQAKCIALGKCLAQFNKDWAKQAKALTSKTMKAKTTRKSKTTHTTTPAQDHTSDYNHFQSSSENDTASEDNFEESMS